MQDRTHRCVACDHPEAERRGNGAWLCDECAADLVTIPAEEFEDA